MLSGDVDAKAMIEVENLDRWYRLETNAELKDRENKDEAQKSSGFRLHNIRAITNIW